jgi:hypothetical protein
MVGGGTDKWKANEAGLEFLRTRLSLGDGSANWTFRRSA